MSASTTSLILESICSPPFLEMSPLRPCRDTGASRLRALLRGHGQWHATRISFLMMPRPPRSTLITYTTLFRSNAQCGERKDADDRDESQDQTILGQRLTTLVLNARYERPHSIVDLGK